jgi:hypothetical protein
VVQQEQRPTPNLAVSILRSLRVVAASLAELGVLNMVSTCHVDRSFYPCYHPHSGSRKYFLLLTSHPLNNRSL